MNEMRKLMEALRLVEYTMDAEEVSTQIGEILTDYISQRDLYDEGVEALTSVLQDAKNAGITPKDLVVAIGNHIAVSDGWTKSDLHLLNKISLNVYGKNMFTKKMIQGFKVPNYDDDWDF